MLDTVSVQYPTDAQPYVLDELADLGTGIGAPYVVNEYYSAVNVPANVAHLVRALVADALAHSAGE